MRDVRAAVIAAALEAGATLVRITGAEAHEPARERMTRAFARGDFATWPYDAAYAVRASDPATLLPGARSVVCIAVAYAHSRPARRGRGYGRVSNYAWSRDYHHTVREMLMRIAAVIDALTGEPSTRIVCDTAPLAERAFAARAGLGWIGKHTNLIVPRLGSYVFLGEIVTTLDLTPDAPLRKSCGSCTRCIDICPTRALRADGTIDATRCISDLTQRTDALPLALRALVGDWVWGCDLCQDACPPTQRGISGAAAFQARDEDAANPDLQRLLFLRSGEFRRRYAGAASGWRGAAVLRRNAAVALGNGLDRADVPALARALTNDPHPNVRAHAAWALGRIGSPQADDALRAAGRTESDSLVLAEIQRARETV